MANEFNQARTEVITREIRQLRASQNEMNETAVAWKAEGQPAKQVRGAYAQAAVYSEMAAALEALLK